MIIYRKDFSFILIAVASSASSIQIIKYATRLKETLVESNSLLIAYSTLTCHVMGCLRYIITYKQVARIGLS